MAEILSDYMTSTNRASIHKYGSKMQAVVCLEELAELQQAITKNMRGRDNRENIIEEMADVIICLDQLKQIYSVKADELEKMMWFKIDRQNRRMAEDTF